MKKLLLIICLVLIFLVGCSSKEITIYQDNQFEEFTSILKNVGSRTTKAYDLRKYEECYAGRIPGFFCSRIEEIEDEEEALDRVVKNLELLLGSKTKTMIILIDNDGTNSAYVSNSLYNKGYKNIHYFHSGYQRYYELAGFEPETGDCDC